MARDRFSIYANPTPDEEPLPGIAQPYTGPTLYGDTYDPNRPMPGQPGYGVVADDTIRTDRALAAEDAARFAAESQGARTLNHRLREASQAEGPLGYSPLALGMNAVPFSDEIMAYVASRGENAPTYEEAERAFNDARSTSSQSHPISAFAGGIGQAAITYGLPLSGAVSEFTLPGVARAAAPTALGGAALGAAGGALTSRPGHRIEDTLGGAATGLGAGAAAGTLGAVGQGLRLTAAAPEVGAAGSFGRRVAGGAAEGLGYAAQQTPDMMTGRIGNPGEALDTFGQIAPYAAGMGGGMGAAGAVLAAPGALWRTVRDVASEPRGVQMPGARPEYDEALADVIGDIPDDALPGVLASEGRDVDLSSSAARARAISEGNGRGSWLERAARLGLTQDPYEARLQSLGLAGRDIERASASFGGPRQLVEAAREVGLLRQNSAYDPSTELAAVAATRDEAGRVVQDYYRRLRESGATVSGSSIGDDVGAIADRFERIDDPRAQSRAVALRNQEADFRYGRGVRPDDTLPGLDGPLAQELPARELSADELLNNLRYRQQTNREIWNTPAERTRPEQQSMLDVQRAEIGARNRLAEGELDPSDYARLRDAQNRYRVGVALAGPSGSTPMIDRRQWGNLRAWMGVGPGAAAARSVPGLDNPLGTVLGGAAGFIGSRLGARYQPSIMATINESGLQSLPATIQASARALRDSIQRGGVAAVDEATLSGLSALAERAPSDDAGLSSALQTLRDAAARAGTPEAAQAIQPAEAMHEWPSFLRGVERLARTSPERLGQFGDLLAASAERGTLAAVIYTMARRNPEAAARLEAEVSAGMDHGIHDVEQQGIDDQTEQLLRSLGHADPNAPDAGTQAPDPMSDAEQRAIDQQNEELLRSLNRPTP